MKKLVVSLCAAIALAGVGGWEGTAAAEGYHPIEEGTPYAPSVKKTKKPVTKRTVSSQEEKTFASGRTTNKPVPSNLKTKSAQTQTGSKTAFYGGGCVITRCSNYYTRPCSPWGYSSPIYNYPSHAYPHYSVPNYSHPGYSHPGYSVPSYGYPYSGFSQPSVPNYGYPGPAGYGNPGFVPDGGFIPSGFGPNVPNGGFVPTRNWSSQYRPGSYYEMDDPFYP